jgi:hypothetical protein
LQEVDSDTEEWPDQDAFPQLTQREKEQLEMTETLLQQPVFKMGAFIETKVRGRKMQFGLRGKQLASVLGSKDHLKNAYLERYLQENMHRQIVDVSVFG